MSWTVPTDAVGRLRRLSLSRELTSIPSLLLLLPRHITLAFSRTPTPQTCFSMLLDLSCHYSVSLWSMSWARRDDSARADELQLWPSCVGTAPLTRSLLTFFDRVSGALPFSGIDILYGRWASGLVNPNPDGSPPSPASIRALSQECAFIGIGITFGMWITTGGFFFCSESSSLLIWSANLT